MEVERVEGGETFLRHAGTLLTADEPRHNLAFGILATARAHPGLYPTVDGWIVRDRDLVVGGAVRTPPHNLVVVRPADDRALAALAAAIDDELSGVVAAVPEVDVFAGAWARRHGARTVTRVEQRIYMLSAAAPLALPDGAFRLAERADRELVLAWWTAFADEVLHPRDAGNVDAEQRARNVDARLTGDGESGIGLWEVEGRPVSLAGFGGPTPNGIRIGPVYTPPELRGRGYGTAVTAATSVLLLGRGRRFCFLYTDLANPTSNSIYQRIGYAPVCDSRELAFVRD